MQQDSQEDLCVCPSFNSYSSDRLAELATKVVGENPDAIDEDENENEDEDGDDFEFTLLQDYTDEFAGEFFYDGQIQPIFPVFNRDLLVEHDVRDQDRGSKQLSGDVERSIRLPLKNLFLREAGEGEPPSSSSSSSSSEADELESISPGTYCVWRPKIVDSSPSTCRKSKSTGSASKRWKFLDLLRRSNSDGKDSFVFLTPKNREKPENSKEKKNSGVRVSTKPKANGSAGKDTRPSPSATHEAFYVRNRAIKEGDKRKSYLPYRKELVGFFVNVNGMGRTFPPF